MANCQVMFYECAKIESAFLCLIGHGNAFSAVFVVSNVPWRQAVCKSSSLINRTQVCRSFFRLAKTISDKVHNFKGICIEIKILEKKPKLKLHTTSFRAIDLYFILKYKKQQAERMHLFGRRKLCSTTPAQAKQPKTQSQLDVT